MADKFALRTRVTIPDTEVQGLIVNRLDQVGGDSICGVAFLTDAGKHMIKTFTVHELAAGHVATVPPNKARKQLRARRHADHA